MGKLIIDICFLFQKPLKRIVIEDIGTVSEESGGEVKVTSTSSEQVSSSSSSSSSSSATTAAAKTITTPTTTTAVTAATTAAVTAAAAAATETSVKTVTNEALGTKFAGKTMVEEMDTSTPPSPPRGKDVSASADVTDLSGLKEAEFRGTSTKMAVTQVNQEADGVERSEKSRFQDSPAASVERRLELPPVPSTSVQFQADWRNLKRDRIVLIQYFKVCKICCFVLKTEISVSSL